MSIAARHASKSPKRSRGATMCTIVAITDSNPIKRKTRIPNPSTRPHHRTRRGWIPQPVRREIAPAHSAPEGRYVYSTRHTPNTPKPQRGDISHLSESRITRITRITRRNCLNQDTQDLRIYRIKGGKPRRHGTGKRGSSLAYYRIKQQLRKSYQLS